MLNKKRYRIYPQYNIADSITGDYKDLVDFKIKGDEYINAFNTALIKRAIWLDKKVAKIIATVNK